MGSHRSVVWMLFFTLSVSACLLFPVVCSIDCISSVHHSEWNGNVGTRWLKPCEDVICRAAVWCGVHVTWACGACQDVLSASCYGLQVLRVREV